MTYLHAVPLCHFCHAFIHDGRLQWLLETGRLNYAKYASIIQHGDAVLAAAGLERPTRIERERYIHGLAINGLLAKWSDWRMVIDGIEFLPLYNSVEEYNEANTKIWEE